MSSGNVWKRLFALQASLMKMVNDGARSLEWLADGLQALVSEPHREFELYFHPKQYSGGPIVGFDLKRHLEETGLINRALSLESPAVKGWLENPHTYPEHYKDKQVVLWGSTLGINLRTVAKLCWRN